MINNMKKDKYSLFELTLTDGSTVIAKVPKRPVTINYAANIAYHWAKIPKEKVRSITGIH